MVTCGRDLLSLQQLQDEVEQEGYSGSVLPVQADLELVGGRKKLLQATSELLGKYKVYNQINDPNGCIDVDNTSMSICKLFYRWENGYFSQ